MPRIISFAYTTPALLAGRKSVTRRHWADSYARLFKSGDIILAYDRSPRAGGKQIATLRLTHGPYQESGWDMPANDFEAEGFAYFASKGLLLNGLTPLQLWEQLEGHDDPWWVLRFEVVSIP